jgi:hypothetical protein
MAEEKAYKLNAYSECHFLTVTAVYDLIKNVLKHLQFNVNEVDTDMLQRLLQLPVRGTKESA